MTTQPSSDLARGLARVLGTGAYSDVLLVCTNGTTFEAHKVVLSAASEFCSKALKPNSFKEGANNRMELVVGDAATIKLMLDYIYTSSYDATNFPEGALTCHLKLIEVADFYVILGLKEMAWANIQTVAQGLRTLPVQEFITALRFVYDTLNHEEKIKKHMIAWAIQDSEHLLNNPTFEEVLSDFSQLGKELTLKMLPGEQGNILRAVFADNLGYFCCDPQSIGMRVIRGSTIHSYCGARTGFTVENATILQPIISSVFDDDDERPSSSSRSSKQTNAAATAGSALAGVAFFTMLVFAFFWWRKRKGGWPSSVRKDRKGEQPLTAVTPHPADDWEKDVAMQNMPMAKSNEPPKPAPMPFIREVTHFELPTDAPTRTSEAEVGWTEMSTKRDSRLPQKEPQEAPNARNSQSVAPPVPPAVPPKDSTVSPISPVLSGKTVTRNNTVTSKRRVSNDGVIRGEPRTSRN
ncbi:hypothetical protein EG328_003275 [Venturia inaequalis]|uniref:BTB domain-containing protein n=1 Tax=Venturia inaequalis TaxID=5025 RepID=A0A8H3YVC4_VENIN|nr:hypothetical protein EG328_003275 [Venturia inaequalis]